MSEVSNELTEGLLDVLPRLLKRLRADLPATPEDPNADPQWKRLVELRSTTGQVALLRILAKQERATMQDLAVQMAVTPATVTAMVKRLISQDYVTRQNDESDWRQVWIRPTFAGQQIIHFYNQRRCETLQRRLDRLSDTERDQIEAALPALRHLTDEVI